MKPSFPQFLIILATLLFASLLLLVIGTANQAPIPGAPPSVIRSFFHFVHQIPAGDKVMHFVLLGSLALLVNLSLRFQTWTWFQREIHVGSLIVWTLACIEETSQLFIPTRTASIADMAANTLGIFVFSAIGARIWRSVKSH